MSTAAPPESRPPDSRRTWYLVLAVLGWVAVTTVAVLLVAGQPAAAPDPGSSPAGTPGRAAQDP